MQIAYFSCQGRATSNCPIGKQAINKKWNWALSHFQVAVNTFRFRTKLTATKELESYSTFYFKDNPMIIQNTVESSVSVIILTFY